MVKSTLALFVRNFILELFVHFYKSIIIMVDMPFLVKGQNILKYAALTFNC